MIPHNQPSLGEQEARAAAAIVSSNKLVQGSQTRDFEDEMCQYLGLPPGHAVCVSSGTSALYVALNVLALQNKKVGLPSYSCTSLKHACTLNNSKPVFLDIKANTPIVETNYNSFDALIYPYLYGFASHLPKLVDKLIIEDVAQALGARTNNGMLGTLGDIGVLSFYATKMISSGGQGGMLVSKDKTLIEQAKQYLNFDQVIDQEQRFNFHITEIQAAIGRVQLRKLPEFIEKRNAIWQIYQDHQLPLMDIDDENLKHVRYRAIVMTSNVNRLINYLAEYGIRAINPFTTSELLSAENINASQLCRQTLSLPIYPNLSLAQAKYIARTLQQGIKI
ncbi:DegT/DnrJ/EryC1/StrS aminotransferase family protein [Endozoicomonas sp. G2_1]|uniref:DegT/DnrJ/EryC1/StrS family aminotransferase n=1 Tax=Endozoicomonas sp. G2_1 TaxID=2821091 RepID=UPI001ADB915E|nr:DegT/DnrJ/EryC1/StrS aminotransferase family protein [Endozoicomonas sp. G2_1]MBO9489054.1 DegT/DnrJ/EryC1/StrS aminotransferase family protein [Endozoicomonas sp. G2_1]